MRREDAQLVEILVARFAVVPPILLVPPVAVGVAELSLNWGGLDVASVLRERAYPSLASLTGHDMRLPNLPRALSLLLILPLCQWPAIGPSVVDQPV